MMKITSILSWVVCASVTSVALAQNAQSGRVRFNETAAAPAVDQSQTAGASAPVGSSGFRIAPLALGWQAGAAAITSDRDCVAGAGWTSGAITNSWVAYYGDPNAGVPKAGDVYRTYVFSSNPAFCQPANVHPWLVLPADTSLAISASNPVTCYLNRVQTTTGCSQTLVFGTSLSGASGYDLGSWGLTGGNVEIQVPITSSSPGLHTLYARIDTVDGWSSKYVTPSVSYTVASNPPTVSYPAPSSTLITSTTARNTADVFNHYAAGTFYFDLGTTTSYGITNAGNAVPGTWDSGQFYIDWTGLTPGTLYHWRGRFVPGVGPTVSGADQTFTTAAAGYVPSIPTGVDAVATSTSQVNVTWLSSKNAASYEVYRRSPPVLSYALLGPVTGTRYVDNTVTANTAYLYRVRALNAVGPSADSLPALAVTVLYSDDPLPRGTTMIKAIHLAELRNSLDAIEALSGPGAKYTDAAVPGVPIKAIHITELRQQYDAAIGVLGLRVSSWADVITPGVVIQNYHIQQLRDRMK